MKKEILERNRNDIFQMDNGCKDKGMVVILQDLIYLVFKIINLQAGDGDVITKTLLDFFKWTFLKHPKYWDVRIFEGDTL